MAVSFNRGKRSAPLPGPLQGCFPRKKLTSLGAEINCQVSRIAANAAEETLLLGLYLDHDRGNRRRGALATQITAAELVPLLSGLRKDANPLFHSRCLRDTA